MFMIEIIQNITILSLTLHNTKEIQTMNVDMDLFDNLEMVIDDVSNSLVERQSSWDDLIRQELLNLKTRLNKTVNQFVQDQQTVTPISDPHFYQPDEAIQRVLCDLIFTEIQFDR